MPHMMNYKRQFVLHNYIKKLSNALDHICAVSWFNICTDWNVCSVVITLVPTFCLDAILYGSVSPHLSDTQCLCAPCVSMYIFCTCVSCYWYETGSKCRCAMLYMCASPCRHGRPNIYAIYSPCSYRCVSPCWLGDKYIYNSSYTNNTCYIYVMYKHYGTYVKSWFVSHCWCSSPRGCGTSHGYCQISHTP